MDFSNCTVQNWPEIENAFNQLEDSSIINKIPLLNVNELDKFKNGALVRFHGMIQDMHGPEYYLEKFEVVNSTTNTKQVRSGKYIDVESTITEDEEIHFYNKNNVGSDRHSYVVISIPALNDWVKKYEVEHYGIKDNLQTCNSDISNKRKHEEDHNGAELEVQKKACVSIPESGTSSQIISKEYLLNFPLPDTVDGKICHLKIYKDSDNLKVNDTCVFIGFLSVHPLINNSNVDENVFNKMEHETRNPPTSIVPRIHVIHFKKLVHYNPLDIQIHCGDMVNIKQQLLLVSTQFMLGDTVAAEYLLYHLLSEVYMRRDFLALGKFSLNISNVPKLQDLDYATELYKLIEMIVLKSYNLPMTLDNINNLAFTPKKDYESMCLTSGVLQLSHNTHILLDETKLSAGKLNPAGVMNVQALSNAIKFQKVSYDFNYYKLEYDCDIPFLIMSEGKSMLPCDVHVVLQPDESCIATFKEIIEAARYFLKPEVLNAIRMYLTQVKNVNYELKEDVQALIEQEFVGMRQERDVTADDLHGLLVLARLICISEGKQCLDQAAWDQARRLDEARRARIKK